MTSNVKLLPLPDWMDGYTIPADDFDCNGDHRLSDRMRDYARANVAHATAAKDAEIEALRAEVGRLMLEMSRRQQQYDERTAYVIVHRGAALACSDAVRSAYSDEHLRAERLAEALRPHIEDLDRSAVVLDQYPAMAPTAAEMRKAAAELRAALHPTAAQEGE